MRRILKYLAILLALELIIGLVSIAPVQAAGAITLTPTIGAPGTTVTVNGSGFTSGETVSVTLGTVTVVSSYVAPAATWSTTFNVPVVAGNTYNVVATGSSSQATPATSFTVTPKITLSKPSGTTGTSVTVNGQGFIASAPNITITFGSQIVSSFLPADANGTFSIPFTVPAGTAGTYTVSATDGTTPASAVFTFIATPVITINRTTGTVGTSTTLNGSGFNANENGVQVTFNGTQVGTTTQASSTGTWSITFAIPPIPSGSYTVGALGSITTASSVATLSFTVTPTFTLDKTSGQTGAAVTAKGTGFAASETNITLTWDTKPIGSPAQADANGSWSIGFNVPATTSGSHPIAAQGSTTTVSSTVSFTTSASMSLSPLRGTVSTSVTVTGSGFGASENGIVVTFDKNQVGTPTTADATGNWSTTFTVPTSSGGAHTIGAKGAITAAGSVPEIGFVTLPTISVNKTNGSVGTSVDVSGTGFGANENNIVISYDSNQVSTGITADITGSWSANFTIPAASAGSHTIKASGPNTPASSVSSVTFKTSSGMSISPTSGYIGLSVNITGSGFANNSALTITYDGTAIPSVQTSTDGSGNFSKSITIPKSTAGPHVIKVSDSSNDSATVNFTVDGTPPPVPNPLSPTDGSKIGLTGNITPDFKWSSVTDPSGVTYELQIDTDIDFPHPLLDKPDLTGTHYTLTQAEALPKGVYFWRVRSVDGASNQSSWSPALTINSGILSSGLLILLIIIAAVIVIALIYLLGINPALKRRKAAVQTAASAAAPEIIIPEVVSAEYRTVDTNDSSGKRALPWRLALPQAPQQPKGPKGFSAEDQARLKSIIDFAKSLPLAETGNNTAWLVDLAENVTGNQSSPALYSQILKGEIQVRYEPAWLRHPTFRDLQDLLEGQPLLQDLNTYVDSVNRTAQDAVQMLQDIYRDTTVEITWDILANGGWAYVAGVYDDSISWFQGKNLRDPSDRDYAVKHEGDMDGGASTIGLYGNPNTAFTGLLIKAPGEKEATQLTTLHLKLRRAYRNSDKARNVVSMLSQLDVQRNKVLNALSQLGRLSP